MDAGQLMAVVGTFVVGLIAGALVRRILSVALLVVALFLALMAFGYLTPDQVKSLLMQMGYQAQHAAQAAGWFRDVVPYSSLTFIVGFLIGLLLL